LHKSEKYGEDRIIKYVSVCFVADGYYRGQFILPRVSGSVTNNNGIWIGRSDLVTPYCTITHNQNQLQELTINLQP
jgi:hypothetical protein